MADYDFKAFREFLNQTPEQALRKMLVDQKPITDVHFGLLLKITRGCNDSEFAEHASKKTFPKVKMSPNETKCKEQFWSDIVTACAGRGLLTPATNKVA